MGGEAANEVKYRPDLDGLRALAILPVVWFHSDLPGLPGGFTGVDTFFVISGYLITLIIHREAAAGNFTFAQFYERRFRRIAPALLLVIAASTLAAYALLLPFELKQFARSAGAALAMVSNIWFWLIADYFALADRVEPLLHTWSLGVEEQFYLLFPAALLVAERFRATKAVIAVLFFVSFAACLVGTQLIPVATFYMLPTRGWELMAGAALAVGLVRIPPLWATTAGLGGIALIAAAAICLTAQDPFPGWRALIPVVGAALVIGSGPDTPSGRFLSLLPLVYIGKVSYSLYLWHWPVFVFLRHLTASTEIGPQVALPGMALTFALAAVSYHWVEQPARAKSLSLRAVIIASGCGLAVLAIALAAAWFEKGLPQRFSASVVELAARRENAAPLAKVCSRADEFDPVQHCRIGAGTPRFVLWGDSHAAAVSEGVHQGIGRPGIIIAMATCPPGSAWTTTKLRGLKRQDCQRVNAEALRLIEGDANIGLVVLSAYWNVYERAGERRVMWSSMQQLVDRLRADGKEVVVIAGIPDPRVDVPWASAIRERFDRPPLKLQCLKAAVPLRRAKIIDVSAGFCRAPASELFTDSNLISRMAA